MRPLVRALAVCLVMQASLAWAHQQKESITRVLFNPRTGNIEVMHRFLLHDAEHAVRELFERSADLLGSEADRNRFADYVQARFSLEDQDGRILPLIPVGHEIDGRFLWVYAETKIPEGLTALTLTHSVLRDLWSEQVNLVNVERNGTVRSAVFQGGSEAYTLVFEP